MSWWTENRTTPKRKSLFYVKISSKFFLPFVKTCSKPSANVETKEFKLINHYIKYPGLVKWSPITITMVDMNGSKRRNMDTALMLWKILKHSGYNFPDQEAGFYSLTGKLTAKDPETKQKIPAVTTLTTPEKEKMNFGGFGPGLTGDYDRSNSGIEIFQVNAEGVTVEHWVLKNPIVKSLKWGDLSYDSDEPVEYTLEIDYDWAEITDAARLQGTPRIGNEYENFMSNNETSKAARQAGSEAQLDADAAANKEAELQYRIEAARQIPEEIIEEVQAAENADEFYRNTPQELREVDQDDTQPDAISGGFGGGNIT